MNRPDLMALVGQRVTVTTPGPIIADPETGKLVALADHPTLILDLDDGRRMVFSQDRCKVFSQDRCKVTPATDTPPAPGQPVDPATVPDWERPFVGLPPRNGAGALTPGQHIRGVAFNAVSRALDQRSHWLPLTARQAIADAVIAALPPATTDLREGIADLNDLITSERATHEQWIRRNDAARALHPTPAELAHANAESGPYCPTCITIAPCPTRTALDGEDTDRG